MYYLMSMHAIDGMKQPLQYVLRSVLTKSCELFGISDYMLPRKKLLTEDQTRRRRERRRERQRRRRRRRYGFDHLTAEERLRDLLPRGPAPVLATPRVFGLAVVVWTSLVFLVFVFGFSSLWLGRTMLRVVVRVKHPHGHDPLAVALGMGGLFFTFQILSLLLTSLFVIIKMPTRKITFKIIVDAFGTIFYLTFLPLMCGCFLAWSAFKCVSIPTSEDLALGGLVL